MLSCVIWRDHVFVLVAFVCSHFVPVGCLLELVVCLWVVGGSRCSVCFVGLCRFVRVLFSACRVSRFVAIGLLVYFLLFFHNVQLVCRLLVVVFSPSWLSSPLSSCTFGSDSVRECTSSFFFLFVLGDRPPPGRGFGCTLFVHFCTSIP